jgi:hypothetical protein
MNKLPLYKGKAYRAESNLLYHGLTALDVVEFEENELGNYNDFKHLNKTIRKQLSNLKYNQVVWVCKTKVETNRYGEAELIDLGKKPKILATDNEGGYLVLKGE